MVVISLLFCLFILSLFFSITAESPRNEIRGEQGEKEAKKKIMGEGRGGGKIRGRGGGGRGGGKRIKRERKTRRIEKRRKRRRRSNKSGLPM